MLIRDQENDQGVLATNLPEDRIELPASDLESPAGMSVARRLIHTQAADASSLKLFISREKCVNIKRTSGTQANTLEFTSLASNDNTVMGISVCRSAVSPPNWDRISVGTKVVLHDGSLVNFISSECKRKGHKCYTYRLRKKVDEVVDTQQSESPLMHDVNQIELTASVANSVCSSGPAVLDASDPNQTHALAFDCDVGVGASRDASSQRSSSGLPSPSQVRNRFDGGAS